MAVNVEYWRWQEYHKVFSDRKWKNKDVITAGVDVGSVGSKAAVMIDGEVYSYGVMRTGSNSPESATKVLGWALTLTLCWLVAWLRTLASWRR